MSCTKKETCRRCNGNGRITVCSESKQEHKVGVYLRGGEYERTTERITCPTCDGQGKVTVEDHDWKMGGLDCSYFICKKCGRGRSG